jgi:hypothetical protein
MWIIFDGTATTGGATLVPLPRVRSCVPTMWRGSEGCLLPGVRRTANVLTVTSRRSYDILAFLGRSVAALATG